ncbi:MAG TPA: nitric oxide reductase large subunit [Prolixibacteraceae bacterium]|jgi:nitric oxide reductase subunit B|nr:nitric oxide reductase large subunit [Prolixibacteraceae bacterium]
MGTKKLWIGFTTVMVVSFAVLLFFGREIYRKAPPIPGRVVTTSGKVIFTSQDIQDGQNVWQSIGGQELGTIWGHGAYVAPDWSADWLHKEAMALLNQFALKEDSMEFGKLDLEKQAALKARLQSEIRKNTYNAANGDLVISDHRAEAIAQVQKFYEGLFTDGPDQAKLREAYAMPPNTVKDAGRMTKMTAFFFWTSWATVTNREGSEISYTNNWPAEELVGNRPTSALILWTGFSVIVLLAGIGLLTFYYVSNRKEELNDSIPAKNPVIGLKIFPSMKATLKYFYIALLLYLVQIGMGIITAHYGVEGTHFYGFNLAQYLPYSLSRTWHVQMGIFWIATSWLATGLFFAPAIGGKDPKYQTLGVNFLFFALLIIVGGSMAGQFFAIMQKLGFVTNFWFGHQGYEYVDLGRFWQIFLLVGLFIWLFLMTRAILPALKGRNDSKQLLVMFLISCIAIAGFYGAGLMWGQHTNLAIAEYWRWWVVHLWVEGFFEVFATVIIAYLFVRMELIKVKYATTTVLFSTIVFLFGGILGTFHHLYFSGTPTAVLALGSSFSALEVVPLILIGFEAWSNLQLSRAALWVKEYKWPINFFLAVAFWNFLGAGILGFLINPPIALYYMQGLNTTPVHGHTALFGVYGMLGIGLTLFVLREMNHQVQWKDQFIKIAFWSINIGLLLMVLISVLPVGLAQTWACVKFGLWYARSADFMQLPWMQTLRWMRVFGDTIFAAGVVALIYFVIGLKAGWSHKTD